MNQKTQPKREFPYVKLVLIVTLVLVVAIVGYSVVDSIGIISQVTVAATTKNDLKLNENHMDVYRYIAGQNLLSNYSYNFYFYALQGYSVSMMASTYGANNILTKLYATFYTALASTGNYEAAIYSTLSAHIKNGDFDPYAYNYAQNDLIFCEAAKDVKNDKNVTLFDAYKAEVADDVDEYMDSLKQSAKNMGISFSTYTKNYMGNGVSKTEIRHIMELNAISAKYSEKLTEDFGDAATMTDIEKYREDNKASFYTSSYYSVTIDGKDLYEKINACKTLDEVTLTIAQFNFDKNYDTEYKKAFETAGSKITDPDKEQTKKDILTTVLAMNKVGDNKEVFVNADSTGSDAYKKAARKTAVAINTAIQSKITAITNRTDKTATEAAYVDISDTANTSLTDLQKWLFASGRKQNDFKAISSTSTSGSTTTTTYTLYIAEKLMKWDTDKNLELTKDIFYIQLTDDLTSTTTESGFTGTLPENPLTALEKATKLYEKLKDVKDKDEMTNAFNKAVEELGLTVSGTFTLQEMVSESALSDKNLKAWVYNPLRKPGDMAILPLSEEDKKVEDAAAESEKETEAETETETEAETEASTETETTAETSKPSTSTTKDKIYLAFFVEENEATWIENARYGIATEKMEKWLDENKAKYEVKVNYDFEETKAETTAESKSETTAESKSETAAESKSETVAETTADTGAETSAETNA